MTRSCSSCSRTGRTRIGLNTTSDATGLINTARTYWANPHTNLVNDEPLEAWLYPATWGQIIFGE